MTLAGVCVVLPLAAHTELPPLPAPEQRGSHERYVGALRAEEERLAAELLSRYERRVAEDPGDRVSAMERCLFLGAAFYDPESDENPREKERLACVEEVEERFASDPEVRVFAVEQRWGGAALAAGRRFLAALPPGSEPRQIAAVHAHLAHQLDFDNAREARLHAEQAMVLDPTLDLRLLIARAWIDVARREEARKVLVERLVETKSTWDLESKAVLLADLGAFDASLAAFREIQRRGAVPTRSLDFARALAGAGLVDEARAAYEASPPGWASESMLRARFEFELEHGSPEAARAAYDALRARGWETDPLGGGRFALLLAHPTAAWKWRDLTGLPGLLAVALAVALSPGLFLIPIWGLGRWTRRRALAAPPPATDFRLRDAWIACALVLFVETIAVAASAPSAPVSPRVAVLSTVALVVALCLYLRHRAVALLARGRWSAVRTLASAAAIVAVLWVVGVALAAATGQPLSDPDTVKDVKSIQRAYGLTAGLIYSALLTPIVEEILFRGVLLSAFEAHLSRRLANITQAALFGLCHFHVAGTPLSFLFGLAMGCMTRSSGSLRPALAAHALNNAHVCSLLASLWR